MRPQQVEARVQRAIENLQEGRTVEDDAGIELKSTWPEPTKSRQLAAAANALRGDVLIYVIGVDDKTGAVLTPPKQEPSEWYARISAAFDQVTPELLGSHTVYLGDGSESVQALVFDTSQFPYVVKVSGVSDRREVPIRVGSATHSAHRNQIIRLFDPTIRLPALEIVDCSLSAGWHDAPSEGGRALGLNLQLGARVFVEHLARDPLTLPVRRMRSRLRVGHLSLHFEDTEVADLDRRLPGSSTPRPPPPQFGVVVRNENVVATGPGEFSFSGYLTLSADAPDHSMSDLYERLKAEERPTFDLALGIAGRDRRARLAATMHRVSEPTRTDTQTAEGLRIREQLGRWKLLAPDEDPWEFED